MIVQESEQVGFAAADPWAVQCVTDPPLVRCLRLEPAEHDRLDAGGRKTYLFAFLDDHSRLAVGYRFGFAEDVVRLAVALERALSSRGVPSVCYVDNGSAYVDEWLLRACAKLGIRLVHSTPHRPQGRGKIERFFRTVRDQFLVEVDDTSATELTESGLTPAAALLELNALFTAWVESVYHHQVHSETGQSPLARWTDGWDRAGHGPVPAVGPACQRALPGLGVDLVVVDAFHPGGEQGVELEQGRRRGEAALGELGGAGVVDLDEELVPHGPKEPFDLASALGSVWGGVHQPDPELGAGP